MNPRLPKITESQIQRSVLDYLAKRQILHYRQNSGAFVDKNLHYYKFSSMNGLPDIVAIIEGYYVALEIKDAKGKLNDNQVVFRKNLLDSGGIYFTIRSLAEAIEAIEDCITRLRLKNKAVSVK